MLPFFAACYTTTNVATMAPLETAYPVSTSSQYVDQGGNIVTENEYEVVRSFAFRRVEAAPRHGTKLTTLTLEPDLDRIMSTTQGDAITALTIQATSYDPGSHYPAAGMKLVGWTLGGAGLTWAVLGPRITGDDGASYSKAGLVTAGLGIVSYLIGAAMNEPASWQLAVQGNVVARRPSGRRRAGAVAVERAR